jgi:hypothetical protein
MGDPAGIKRQYWQFAETECKGYSDLYYRLALSVSEDDEVAGFIADMPVPQPNLFLASIQMLTGPAAMPATGSGCTLVRRRGDEVHAGWGRGGLRRTKWALHVLLPAFTARPVALVSARCRSVLLFERHHYEFGSTRLGAASARACGHGDRPVQHRRPSHGSRRRGLT